MPENKNEQKTAFQFKPNTNTVESVKAANANKNTKNVKTTKNTKTAQSTKKISSVKENNTTKKAATPTRSRAVKKKTLDEALASIISNLSGDLTDSSMVEKKISKTSPPKKKADKISADKKNANTKIKKDTNSNKTDVKSKHTPVKNRNSKKNTEQLISYKSGGDNEVSLSKPKLKIIPLGGLNEIGKNMTVVEYENDIVIIDCGLAFPDTDMPGIDIVIPDTAYLEKNRDKIRGVVLTHGHEDHIGSLPYFLREFKVPVYGSELSIGLVRNKLVEHRLDKSASLLTVKAGQKIKLGNLQVEFIHVNHSIADAMAIAVKTPVGVIVHTGDFKIDTTPIQGEMMDLTRFGELGKKGVLLLMSDSTNAERPGYAMSEKKVGKSLDNIFNKCDKRIIVATFASNVHRVQQIINAAHKYGRKVAISGRSMINIVSVAMELGYMQAPKGTLVELDNINRYPPEKMVLITTGSQGEPMSALYRMAFSDHKKIEVGPQDLVVISASPIPGNEKTVTTVVNELLKSGVTVIADSVAEVHVSGHACQEEIKLILGLIKPKFFMPVHGEYKHLTAAKNLGIEMGIPKENIIISDIGKTLELDENSAKITSLVPSGRIFVDGLGVGDVGNIVLRDRKHLAQDGLIVVVASIEGSSGTLVSGPDIVSRGFVYVRESEDMMEKTRIVARNAIDYCFEHNIREWAAIKSKIRDDISDFLYSVTKRRPMILPIIMDV